MWALVSGVDLCSELVGHRNEARRAEARGPKGRGRVEFIGEGAASPLPQLEGLGERSKLPQWGPGRSPGRC